METVAVGILNSLTTKGSNQNYKINTVSLGSNDSKKLQTFFFTFTAAAPCCCDCAHHLPDQHLDIKRERDNTCGLWAVVVVL